MKTNFKGTIGEYFEQDYRSYSNSATIRVKYADAQNIDDVLVVNGYQRTKKDVDETVKLVLDAFNIRQQINCDLPEFFERYNKAMEEQKKSEEEIVKFGLWLTQNCTPSSSKDGWWVFRDDIWLTTNECLDRFKEEQVKTIE